MRVGGMRGGKIGGRGRECEERADPDRERDLEEAPRKLRNRRGKQTIDSKSQ